MTKVIKVDFKKNQIPRSLYEVIEDIEFVINSKPNQIEKALTDIAQLSAQLNAIKHKIKNQDNIGALEIINPNQW